MHNTYFLMDHWQNLCSQKIEPLVLMTKWRSIASHNFIIPHFQSSAQISSVHADQASDRTSVVSLRNLDNGGQCGSDLRLGRSPGAFPSTWTRSQVSPPFPQARSSALPSKRQITHPQQLLHHHHHHLADPPGVRPPPTDNAYYESLEITSAPTSATSALQDLFAPLPHHFLAMSLKPPSLY